MSSSKFLLLMFASAAWLLASTEASMADSGATTEPAECSVYGGYVHAHWTPGGNEFWYESFGPYMARTFWWVDTETGKRTPVFNGTKLKNAIDKTRVIDLDPEVIELDDVHRIGVDQLQLDIDGYRFRYNPATNDITYLGDTPAPVRPLKPLPAVIPSAATDEETTVKFLDHTSRKLTVWTVDEAGVQTYMGPVCRRECPAVVGQVFVVKDEQLRTLGAYQAVGDPSEAVVDDLTVPTTNPSTQPSSSGYDSPDGKWQAFRRDYNLFLRDSRTGEETQLSTDGRAGDGYVDDPKWAVAWSPDSTKIFVGKEVWNEKPLFLVQSCPSDQLEPKLFTLPCVRPTDPIVVDEPHLFNVAKHSETKINQLPLVNPGFLRWKHWNPESTQIDVECLDRNKQSVKVVAFNALTGQATTLIDEHSETFVDISSDEKCARMDVPSTKEFIFTSERDGWNHAYLYDAVTGKLKNQITRGHWVVRELMRVDPETRRLWCKVGGLNPKEDPYDIHVCRVNFDGTGLIDLTPAEGTHSIEFSPDNRFYLDTYSRVDLPTVTELRKSENADLICTVDKADWTDLLASGWHPPERFVAKGRDGVTDIFGVIYRPAKFDASKKYPVVERVYAGPQGTNVAKEFGTDETIYSLIGRGFIVVEVDGMGTNFRSKAFHDVCWHNLADAGFPDRILWIKAAAAKYPQLDLSRVGIYGCSSGGENAVRALESYGDFYKAAVAGFGIYDDRGFSGSEFWMGWPVGPWYEQQSDVHDAAKIKGKLLLIGGDLDHTVDPALTMQMVNALIKADKDFELLIIPNADHGQFGDYGNRRQVEFFVRNLLESPAK